MFQIRSYDARSLDRSTNTIFDTFNKEAAEVENLYITLKGNIITLQSRLRSISERVQVLKEELIADVKREKDIASDNDIQGAETILTQIETLIEQGDADIKQAESDLENISKAADCQQCNYSTSCEVAACAYSISIEDSCSEVSCGECGQVVSCEEDVPCDEDCDEACIYCSYTYQASDGDAPEHCDVCVHAGLPDGGLCNQEMSCKESTDLGLDNACGNMNCPYSQTSDPTCSETTGHDNNCDQDYCVHQGAGKEDCSYSCTDYSGCNENSMPQDCSYTSSGDCAYDPDACGNTCSFCAYNGVPWDANPCSEDIPCGEDCSEGCGEGGCNNIDCSEYDCGEECGETCGMYIPCSLSDDCSESCGEDSCSEGTCGDCGNCGEGEGCGDWSEFCGESNCSESGDDSGGDDSNVICTEVINRIFNGSESLKQMSNENVRIAFKNGLSAKAWREYRDGLGLEIISHLTDHEELWNNRIKPVWKALRSDNPKRGMRMYAQLVYDLAKDYNIDLNKYPHARDFLIKYEVQSK